MNHKELLTSEVAVSLDGRCKKSAMQIVGIDSLENINVVTGLLTSPVKVQHSKRRASMGVDASRSGHFVRAANGNNRALVDITPDFNSPECEKCLPKATFKKLWTTHANSPILDKKISNILSTKRRTIESMGETSQKTFLADCSSNRRPLQLQCNRSKRVEKCDLGAFSLSDTSSTSHRASSLGKSFKYRDVTPVDIGNSKDANSGQLEPREGRMQSVSDDVSRSTAGVFVGPLVTDEIGNAEYGAKSMETMSNRRKSLERRQNFDRTEDGTALMAGENVSKEDCESKRIARNPSDDAFLVVKRYDVYGFEVRVGRPVYFSALCENDFEMGNYWLNLIQADRRGKMIKFDAPGVTEKENWKANGKDDLDSECARNSRQSHLSTPMRSNHGKCACGDDLGIADNGYKKYDDAVLSGIPHEMRKHVWDYMARIFGEETYIPGYYANLKANGAHPKWGNQIALDLNRTFYNHSLFKDRDGEGQIKLFNVLNAYSFHNQTVGYCQGMNFVVATLIMIFEEEEHVFWILTLILSRKKLWSYYEPGFSGLLNDIEILRRILTKNYPKIEEHLESLGINCAIFFCRWLLQLFTNFEDWKMVLRLWDLIFTKGRIANLQISLAILSTMEEHLLEFNSIYSAIPFLINPSSKFIDMDVLLLNLKNLNIESILSHLDLNICTLNCNTESDKKTPLKRVVHGKLTTENLLMSVRTKSLLSSFWCRLTTPSKTKPKKLKF